MQIDLDNGPEQASNRTQFIKRLLKFADKNGLVIELVYYPPYHSKYNSVERCWGILEQHWNGAILNSREAVLSWAQTMTCQRYFPSGTAVGDRVRQGGPSQPKVHAAVRITAVPVATAWQVERRDFSLD